MRLRLPRLPLPRSRLIAISAAVAALAVLAIPGVASASTGARSDNGASCVTISFEEELIWTQYQDVAPPGPSVGDVGTTLDAVLIGGQQIGTDHIRGVIVAQDPATGDLLADSTATYDIPDGQISASGIVDLTAELEGKTQTLPAVGLTGLYEGKTGELTWTSVSPTESQNSITLCG